MEIAEHLYTHIAKNRRATLILLFLISLLFIIVGYFIGAVQGSPVIGVSFAFIFSLVTALISFYMGDKIILRLMGAEIANSAQYQQLYNVVEEMCIAGGLPMPKVYIIQSAASNAFATGRNPRCASIAVTTGLLEIMSREELQAVIGHEMSHVKHYDTLYLVIMAVMVGAIAILCDSFWRYLRHSGRIRSSRAGKAKAVILIVAVVLAILAPIAAKIIQLAMSRRRELLADNGSAVLTRNPEALARALEKIAGDHDPLDVANRGVQHLFIVNPLHAANETGSWATILLSTHPPLQERVKILRQLAHTYSSAKKE